MQPPFSILKEEIITSATAAATDDYVSAPAAKRSQKLTTPTVPPRFRRSHTSNSSTGVSTTLLPRLCDSVSGNGASSRNFGIDLLPNLPFRSRRKPIRNLARKKRPRQRRRAGARAAAAAVDRLSCKRYFLHTTYKKLVAICHSSLISGGNPEMSRVFDRKDA